MPGGLLGSARNREERPDGNDEEDQQEFYEQIRPKIQEDFLDKEDFVVMMQKLMEKLDPEAKLNLDWTFNENAERKASGED